MNWVMLFSLLVCGHVLMDYPLQTDFMAQGKNRHVNKSAVPWYYLMLAHSILHGGMVGVLTNSLWLGLAEAGAHFCIDCLKCEGLTNIHQDQAAHVVCKVAWAIIVCR